MRKSKAILIWSAAIGMTISMTSCLKTSEPTKNPAQTYISIMQLATSPATPAVDVYFESTKVSGNTAFAPGAISSAYSAVQKGIFSISFKKAGSDSLVAALPPNQYDSLGFYTVFLFNQPAGPVTAALIEDDFTDLTLDKPFVRFFHGSPAVSNLGPVDVWMDNAKVTALSGRSLGDNQYGGYFNEFQPTTAGNHSFQIKLSSNDSLITTLTEQPLIAGNAYTLYLKGNTATGTGANVISLGILRAAN